jgi:uncharacterized protein
MTAMVIFITTFVLLYSILHSYLFFRARVALSMSPLASALFALFMVIMITAPILIRLSENAALPALARILSFVGYTWLGVLFLWVCSTIIFDIYRLGIFALGKVLDKNLSFLTISIRSYFIIACVIVVLVSIYGIFEARVIKTSNIIIETRKLPAQASPLTIAQVSDIHLGLIVGKSRLESILRAVNAAQPDILVSTGDLVDGQMNGMEDVAEMLNQIRPKYGKFAVTGNHEFYAGLDQALDFTRKAGFTILRNEAVSIADMINIAGIDDPSGFGSSAKGEKELLSRQPQLFTLLLKHRPDADKDSLGLFDLQLSGHVHYGQIFPFRYFTRIPYRLSGGLYSLAGGSMVYVSRGTGTWGPPIRFLAPPEVTIIKLVPKTSR